MQYDTIISILSANTRFLVKLKSLVKLDCTHITCKLPFMENLLDFLKGHLPLFKTLITL